MRIAVIGVGRIGALHATNLAAGGDLEVLVADIEAARAAALAERLGIHAVSVAEALTADAVVIAAASTAHPQLITEAAVSGRPVFCEKPVAADLAGTHAVLQSVRTSGVPVQIGFQRRFDVGHVHARELVLAGGLGWLHTVRSQTLDPAPPPAAYLLTSGGIFRDCSVHDIDAIRWVTGREVIEVYAVGANRGADFFAAAGDVDTGAALLTLDDGTIGQLTATRYNAAGYDVRLEALGSAASVAAGLDAHLPLTSTEPDTTWPPGPACTGFVQRFGAAYRAEMATFLDVAADRAPSPCTVEDALEAFYVAEAAERSRQLHRPVRVGEIRR